MSEAADRLHPAPAGPLGAHCDGRGIRFAVYAAGAEKVELCLFDASGRHEQRLVMPDCIDGVWHGYLPGARGDQLYGYRAYGPYEPKRGLRYNGNKLLVDPYAKKLAGALRWHDALYGYRVGSPRGDLSFDRRDSAAYLPKCVACDERFEWGNDHPPQVPWPETVIYEMHLRGFSMRHPEIPEHERGSFGALGHPAAIAHLKRLGITAVELLPVHAFLRDRMLEEKQLTNYWGYNTLGYFAPEAAYLSDGTPAQMKWAVQQLHAAGIEVILDVVYNHTCEGNELGPTLSFRGLDNASYYRLLPDDPRRYINDTGCGNTVNCSHPRVIQLIMDSLRWWVSEYHVDGFRFDLGVTLGREPQGFDPGCGLFDAMRQDPLLARVKLISEPWDIGPGGYQIGNHPPGFSEWNGKFRDDVRRYWKGDAGVRPALAARLQGSAEMFDRERRRPWASVNFITAHDGYTLHDLVSYNGKHNQANGEDNHDGANDNESSNWGAEGPTDNPEIVNQRDKIKRALLLTLLASHGTPMLLAGDEFGQTQQGNNNAYCQDNDISWLDWSRAGSEAGRALTDFCARLLALRREQPLLQGREFQHARVDIAPGVRDIDWFDERGIELLPEDWNNANGRLLGLRRSRVLPGGGYESIALLCNSDGAAHSFRLPEPAQRWQLLVDTHRPAPGSVDLNGNQYEVAPHSAVLLHARELP
ncbi:MAG TPA: glycogen debranching protein GlgX [Nevskiaceae bacterium]|nr:glycogen debranching protein GlgX [Nevskiaceae bacterium]